MISQFDLLVEERTAIATRFGTDRHTDQGKEIPYTTDQHGMFLHTARDPIIP